MEVSTKTTSLISDDVKLSAFLNQPNVRQLLATTGGNVAVDVLATILNRPAPTREEIRKARVNL